MKNFVEFFAGVGLVREGLKENRWNCVWANDISHDKYETYSENFGSSDFYQGDIWDVARTPEIVPDGAFLYTASFPCTDLSVAGGRAGLAGKESGTINALFRIIEDKKRTNSGPKVVLLENVKGFLTSHQGMDAAHTVKVLSDLGYFVDIIELDAIDFSAQSRPRVFLIAVEEDLAIKTMHIKSSLNILDSWWAEFNKSEYFRSGKIKKIVLSNEDLNWALFDIPTIRKSSTRLPDIIDKEIPNNSELWWNQERQMHLYSQMSASHKSILNSMIDSPQISYGTVYRRMRKGVSTAEMRVDGYAGCLRTPRGGSSKQIVIQAGKGDWKVRLLTPREYARLQGVRDSFIMPENVNKGYFAMGDAVCVPVIEFISENILERLYNEYLKMN